MAGRARRLALIGMLAILIGAAALLIGVALTDPTGDESAPAAAPPSTAATDPVAPGTRDRAADHEGVPEEVVVEAEPEDLRFELTGAVRDETGLPVTVVHILARDTERPGRTTESATMDGRYQLSLRAGVHALSASVTGGEPVELVTVRIPDVSTVDLVVPRLFVLEGELTNLLDGEPLTGTLVAVTSLDWVPREEPRFELRLGTTTTDADGAFELPLLLEDMTHMSLELPERPMLVRRSHFQGSPGGRHRLVTSASTFGSVTGVVRGPAGPVDRGTVSLGRHQYSVPTPIGPRGEFRVTGFQAGEHQLTVRATGFLSYESDVMLGALEETRHDVSLQRGVVVRGRVLDASGAPLGGATVSSGFADARTDASGAFDLGGFTIGESPVFIATAPGHRSERRTISIDSDAQPEEFRLAAWPRITGTVLRPDGQPARSARIRVGSPAAPPSPDVAWTDDVFHAHPDGTFDVPLGFDGDSFTLLVLSSGVAPTRTPAVRIEPDREQYEVDVRLVPGHVVTGTVQDEETGAPIPGAWIEVPSPVNTGERELAAVSDAKGAFTLTGVPAETDQLWARGERHYEGPVPVEPADGKPVWINLRPRRAIEGVVRFADERPIEHVTVRAGPDGIPERALVSATTGPDGRFRVLTWWGNDTHRVELVRGDDRTPFFIIPEARTATPGQDLVFVVETGLSVTGRATPPAGDDWSLDSVIAMWSDGQQKGVVRETFGFHVGALPSETATIFARFQNPQGDIVTTVLERVLPGPGTVVVPTPSALTIEGSVAEGVAHEFVWALPAIDEGESRAQKPRRWRTRPDAEGRFRLQGLPPGTYHVAAATRRDAVWERDVAAGTTGVVIGAD